MWSVPLLWCSIALPAVVGCLGFYRELVVLSSLWTGDPLRSIGIFIPPVSILLTLRGSREAARDAAGKAAEIAEAGIDEMLSYYAIRLYSDQIVSQGRRRNSLYDRKTPGEIFQPGG